MPIRYGLSNYDTKMSPQLSPYPPHLGVENVKKREKSNFLLSNDKTLLWSCSDQLLPAAALFV